MGSSMPLVGHSLAIFICAAVMMSVSIMAVALRTFVRIYTVRAFGWDDALMVIALALFIALDACWMVASKRGVGHKNEDFTDYNTMEQALLWWWLCQMLYSWSAAITKISIAIALLRLAVHKAHRIVLWTVTGVVIIAGIMIWLVFLAGCQPVSYFWSHVNGNHEGSCIRRQILLDVGYLYSFLIVLSDVTLGIMPAVLIWHLQMDRRTKIALAGVLSLGALESVAVIIRIPYLHTYHDTNLLYATYQIDFWSIIEIGIGITAGSLATLRPLFLWVFETRSYYGGNSRGKKQGEEEHPLSNLSTDAERLHNPSNWGGEFAPGKSNSRLVTTVTSRLSHSDRNQDAMTLGAGSWQALYQVNIQTTIKISEGVDEAI
ncbi:pectinesterase precursor [Aspergillus costaricaensis CBS 115574]|uniref:Pectinesterase n=1 Tax=Aspergillus costaricaensis CBS 115574 TaxID=1448317 RepID=A0ACD1IG01_9EURO|nr:pectinesterase precursor [Aspergillus costaricaensis CBS 115574]RAK89425.1 pectinesterase precursor [Aspergillus costaricaensis CBS 115574]